MENSFVIQEEEFLGKNSRDGGFLQSSYWEKFQKSLGREILSWDNFGNEKEDLKFRFLAIKYFLPFVGGYYFVPRGPILSKENFSESLNKWENFLEKMRIEGINWVRIEPQEQAVINFLKENYQKKGWLVKKSPKDHEPPNTLFVDLKQNEKDLLSVMKPKTRYAIRLAQRKKVRVFVSEKQNDLDDFFELVKETAQRNKITFYPKSYYLEMRRQIPLEKLKLFLASYEKRIIAGAFVSFFSKTATYLHGASSNYFRNVMAMHLIQWEAILMAKKQGFLKYDLGGLNPDQKNYYGYKENWQGISRFKRGFAPKERVVSFPGSWDIIFDKVKYQIYLLGQKAKSLMKKMRI